MAGEESNSWSPLSNENCLKLLEEPPDGKVRFEVFTSQNSYEIIFSQDVTWDAPPPDSIPADAPAGLLLLVGYPTYPLYHRLSSSISHWMTTGWGRENRVMWTMFFSSGPLLIISLFIYLINMSLFFFSRCPVLDFPEMYLLNEKAALDKRCVTTNHDCLFFVPFCF